MKTTRPAPTFLSRRGLASMWRQSKRSLQCPETPRLDGKRALVTGGNAGIGLETTRGLARRGAEVILAARNEARGCAAKESISRETSAELEYLPLDLSNLESVSATAAKIDQPIDVFVANGGMWPRDYAQSAQGHEIAFATNVLGHHLLIRLLLERELLRERIIMITGDIYIMAKECTSDFTYRGNRGGLQAYCRSKLGNLWQTRELQRRYPALQVFTVHPGVVASELGGAGAEWLRRTLLIDAEAGAQTTLYCATQPDLVPGGYYHNTQGRVDLDPRDPAANDAAARALWDRLEELCVRYLEV